MRVPQVHVIGPSVVGSYYGKGDQVAHRKGDFGRLLVLAGNQGTAALAAHGGDSLCSVPIHIHTERAMDCL